MNKISVVFVCLGNICRSPTAHGIFEHIVEAQGLSDRICIDSAGTGDWHLGQAPDSRSVEAAHRRGIDLSALRSRLVSAADFDDSAYILAMDAENLSNLEILCPNNFAGHLGLFLDYSANFEEREVPDPYYSGAQGFDLVIDLIEDASAGLLQHLQKHHRL